MASIKKRDNGKWRARYRDAAGKEHARHFDKKFQAQDWLDEQTTAMRTNSWVEPKAGRITLEEWFGQWSAVQVWEPGTYDAAELAITFTPFYRKRLDQITVADVQGWVKSMTKPVDGKRKKGLEPSTIRNRHRFLHVCLGAAVKSKKIPSDPSADVALPRLPRKEHAMAIPTPEQVGQVLQASDDYFRLFIAIAAFAGLRLGEIAGLQVSDVDFLKRAITVNRQIQGNTNTTIRVAKPKYGSTRTVYVSERLIEMVSVHIAEFGVREDASGQWLFDNGGYLFQRGSAGGRWRGIRAQVKMDAFTLHDLRHFFASGLIAQGCDVVTVQRALGHSNTTTTLNTYSHLWPTAADRTRTAGTALISSVVDSADYLRTDTQTAQ